MSRILPRAAGAPRLAASALAALGLLLAACGAPVDAPEAAHDDHDDHEHAAEGHAGEDHADLVRLSEADLRAAGVVMRAASVGALPDMLSLPAEIRFDPDRLANVSIPVEGTVRKLLATEGDRVAAGDVLAVISSRELADLKAEYLTAQADEALARSEAARAEGLLAADAVSEAEALAARADADRARAARAAAETKLHALGLEHDVIDRLREADDGEHSLFRLTAPIAGRVLARNLTLGETIEADEAAAEPAFVIADTSVVWVYVTVFKADLDRVREGDALTLAGDPGRIPGGGEINFISPVIDEASRTGTARAVIPNPDGALRPGQFVTARIETGASGEALLVPADAVQTVEGTSAVFVPEDGGFAPRPVTPGRRAGGQMEILSGLEPGERFVAEGAFTLKAELEKSSFGDGHNH